jgi:hypothetical protein
MALSDGPVGFVLVLWFQKIRRGNDCIFLVTPCSIELLSLDNARGTPYDFLYCYKF